MNDHNETKAAAASPDPDNNLGRGAPQDREGRIRQRVHEIWEREGRPEGHAESDWARAAQDLDREDEEFRRKDAADQAAGVKPAREPKREKSDVTKT